MKPTFLKKVTPAEKKKYGSDFIYVGSANKSNWGYKRVLFLNIFKDHDLKGIHQWQWHGSLGKFFPGAKEQDPRA